MLIWLKYSKFWAGPFGLISVVPYGFYVKRQAEHHRGHYREVVKQYDTGVYIGQILSPTNQEHEDSTQDMLPYPPSCAVEGTATAQRLADAPHPLERKVSPRLFANPEEWLDDSGQADANIADTDLAT